ncbi:autotransporter-associated beta strand repeat-containing protein [Haloferula sp. BvORR071]|uniref:beta strand repeat-containing protein n=1 Tax=Haloferula sp. BvORR071 TaxID=1396141 RepID=UPI000A445A50|nr:autotransporter-associated beta strand repeat-containing protein [Haloferula sp. BvORR071]
MQTRITHPSATSRRSALLLAALASVCCCGTAAAVDATYQYYRFTPIKLRNDGTANSIQLAEFAFLKSGAAVPFTGATVTNPGGNRTAAEIPANLIDGLTTTKWLDFYRNPIVFAFTAPVTIDGYRFSTANDASERDPVRWILEGSADQTTWVLLDHTAADFATPTARQTTSGDILLGATPVAYAKTWNGGDPANWDSTTQNWDKGGPVAWDNASTDVASFSAGTPASVSLAAPISARMLDFTAPVTLLQRNTLTLTNVTRISPGADMEISSVLAGSVGVIKTGSNKLTLSGANTYTGPLQIRAGSAVVSGTNAATAATQVSGGATLTFTGAAAKGTGVLEVGNAAGNGTVIFEQTGTLTFNATPVVGTGAIASAGAIRQTAGTVTFAQDGQYITLGNTTGSYGSFELSGGTATTPTGAGVRVGFNGTGVLTQTGGTLTSNRWFAIANANGRGVYTITGGTAGINSASYRLIGGDSTNGIATINIGTALGGTGSFSAIRNAATANDGAVVLGAAAGTSGTLNLNSGVLKISSRIFRQSTVTSTGIVNFNGGTLTAGANNIELATNSLTAVRMLRGGATINTDGNASTFAAPIVGMGGNGLAFTGLPATVGTGGSGYLGAPAVTVTTSGTGTGVTAIANVSNGAVTGITITSPGDGYAVGDTVTFDFVAVPGATAATAIAHTLLAEDLAPNNTGTLTKSGGGALTLTQPATFVGNTAVSGGSLVVNTSLSSAQVNVAAGTTLTGSMNLSGTANVDGILAPGVAVGTATGAGALNLNGGSTLALQLTDWTGVAGTGFDTVDFGSIATTATALNKLTIQVDTTGLVNFAEGTHSFVIGTADAPPTGFTADNWQVAVAGGFTGTSPWSLGVAGNNLVLTYAPVTSGYASWIGSFPGLSDTSSDGDPDGDGVPNVLEYVLNSNPGTGSGSGLQLPVAAATETDVTFTFVRRAESKSDTTQTFLYGPAFPGTEVPVPASSSGIFTITPDSPAVGLETVVVTVPRTDPQIFGRLKATKP